MRAAFLVLAAFAAGCADAPRPEIPRPTRGYILISLDTLRADHLGCYGYERDTSPFLDRLAERAVTFENAFVQYPSTLTSHMSIFTGLYPAEHGIYPPGAVLSDEIETLPEVFQRAGFRTGGFTEGGWVQGRFGFRRGFDVFKARDRQVGEEVDRTFERGLRFLRGLAEEERFFLFLHTYAVHAPYHPPESYRDRFWEGEAPPGAYDPTGPALTRHNILGETLTPAVLDYFTALYDAGIRHLDDVLAGFFSQLEELGLTDTTVIITSDHGEELHDHGKMNHGQLYREVLRVPLLILHPDFADGRRHEPPVRSIDLAPTLYELARAVPAGEPSGESLAGYLVPGPVEPAPRTAFADVSGTTWSVVDYDAARLFQLIVFQPPAHQWITRRLEIDVSAGPLSFDIRSFQDERTLEISHGAEKLRSVDVGPEWTRVELELSAGRGPVVITAGDCTLTETADGPERCYSFRVRGVPLGRAELYDLAADPRESADLSGELADRTRSLYAKLTEYRARAASEAQAEALDEKLRAELEALGYLQ